MLSRYRLRRQPPKSPILFFSMSSAISYLYETERASASASGGRARSSSASKRSSTSGEAEWFGLGLSRSPEVQHALVSDSMTGWEWNPAGVCAVRCAVLTCQHNAKTGGLLMLDLSTVTPHMPNMLFDVSSHSMHAVQRLQDNSRRPSTLYHVANQRCMPVLQASAHGHTGIASRPGVQHTLT